MHHSVNPEQNVKFSLQTLFQTKKRLGCNSSIVYSALKGAKGITISQLGHSKDGAIWRQDTGHWWQVSGDTEGRIETLGDRIKGHRCPTIWRHRGPINSCGALTESCLFSRSH